MRKLIVRFNSDGDYYREIDEGRNYYLAEAEMIVSRIRTRLGKEKKIAASKPFELWLDGKQLIITSVSFEASETLEEQLIQTMEKSDTWKEDMKHKHINLLKEYAKEERQLFVNKEFESFVVRFDEVLGNRENLETPLLFDINQLKKIFDNISVYVETGFYTEVEHVIETVKLTYKTVMKSIRRELLDLNKEEGEELKSGSNDTFESLFTIRLKSWLDREENFNRFVNFTVARYQSVSESRLGSLRSGFKPYQKVQNKLFKEYQPEIGFEKALEINDKMNRSFEKKYEEILFNGFSIRDDDSLVSLVINPVCNEYLRKIDGYSPVVQDEPIKEQVMENAGE